MSDLIKKIKELFETKTPEIVEASATEVAATADTFKDVKTSDGLILRIDGASVSVIAEDGSITPAPIADYTLEDGTVISVKDDGIIAETMACDTKLEEAAIVDPNAPVEPAVEDPAEDVVETDRVVALEAKVAELEAAIAQVTQMCNDMMAPNEEAMKEVKKENKELKKQVKELASEPAVAEKTFKKVDAVEILKSKNKGTTTVNETLMSKILALKDK